MNKIIMKMRKFLLSIALLLPYSLPAVAYDLNSLKKLEQLKHLEELEQLEKLQRLQRLQQLEHEAKTEESASDDPKYYVRLYAGCSSCIQGEPNIPASFDHSSRNFLTQLSNFANQHASSPTFGLAVGMYCTKSIRLEATLNYTKEMVFGCDMCFNTTEGQIKLENVPLGTVMKAIADLTSTSLPSALVECKLYWDMFSGSIGSVFATGGVCAQYLFTDTETPINNRAILPGSTVGLGAAINITKSISLTVELNGVYLSSSHLHYGDNVKVESWYGYNSVAGLKYNF